jgi:hypothetical protein
MREPASLDSRTSRRSGGMLWRIPLQYYLATLCHKPLRRRCTTRRTTCEYQRHTAIRASQNSSTSGKSRRSLSPSVLSWSPRRRFSPTPHKISGTLYKLRCIPAPVLKSSDSSSSSLQVLVSALSGLYQRFDVFMENNIENSRPNSIDLLEKAIRSCSLAIER